MSHFIQMGYSEPVSVLKVKKKILKMPSRAQKSFNLFQQTSKQQKKVLLRHKENVNRLCNKFKEIEFTNLNAIYQKQVNKQYEGLKKKLRKNVNQENIQKIMLDKKKTKVIDLGKVVSKKYEQIQIQRNYHNILNLKIRSLDEASQIQQTKTNQNKWNNTENNSPTKSPIFQKMTYLIEKFDKLSNQSNEPSNFLNRTFVRRSMDGLKPINSPRLQGYSKIKRNF